MLKIVYFTTEQVLMLKIKKRYVYLMLTYYLILITYQ